VLHRDVKPSNLLLDVWGSVWLTDFGLAKATGTPDLTGPGDLLGTLRYMAPERFAGRADVRSDVYALGLTLYEALALRPAFDDPGQVGLMQQIATAEPPRLDRLVPRLPRDLVTVVHKAMAKGPADRYQTAGALAEDLRRFLDDRPIAARRLSALEQAWRWCRRNPAAAALVAALLALALLASGGGVWLVWQRAEAARQKEALRKEVKTAVAQAADFRKRPHFRQAREVLEQAKRRLEPAGPDDLRQLVNQARADLDLAEKLDTARLQTETFAEGKFNVDLAGSERLYAAAFAESGLGREGDDIEAVAARVRGSAVREEIVAALDDWASLTKDHSRRVWLFAVARGADPGPWRDRLRQPRLWKDRARLKELIQEVKVEELSWQLASTLGRVLPRRSREATSLLAAAQARFPNDFWLNFRLAATLNEAERWDEALGYWRVVLALRPDVGMVHNNLGVALAAQGRRDEAIRHFQQALRLDPECALAHYNLGLTLRAKGRQVEAIGSFQRAIELEYAPAHHVLGNALAAQGRLDAAINHYRQALQIDPKYALAHLNLGNALAAQGRRDAALGHYRRAIQLDPEFAPAHYNLGNALAAQGRRDEAIGHYQRAIQYDPKFAPAHNNLGNALRAKGRLDAAIGHFQEALRLDPKFAHAHNNLGHALAAQGQRDAAIDHYQQALRIDPKYALAHYNLGNALAAQGRRDEAIRHYQGAIELDPGYAPTHYNLGNALAAQGQRDEAIRRYHQALRLNPKYAQAHGALGHALLAQGRFTEGQAATRRCLELLPQAHPLRPRVTRQLRLGERMLALEARLPTVLQGRDKPANAAEGLQFAQLCRVRKRYAAAARLYAGALAADPKLAGDLRASHRYNAACAAALAAAGHGADAATLGDEERAHLRRQALTWLTADLAAWATLIKDSPRETARARQALRHWQTDGDLAGVRDAGRLTKLPAAEQEACRRLWAEVDALLRRSGQVK
jgi:tetratricopeptide (TPR) repeat protein